MTSRHRESNRTARYAFISRYFDFIEHCVCASPHEVEPTCLCALASWHSEYLRMRRAAARQPRRESTRKRSSHGPSLLQSLILPSTCRFLSLRGVAGSRSCVFWSVLIKSLNGVSREERAAAEDEHSSLSSTSETKITGMSIILFVNDVFLLLEPVI